MAAKIVTLCDELVAYLNTLSLSQSYTAIRRNVWFSDLADTNALQVVVVPQETETTVETRQATARRFRVLVIVEKRMTTGDDISDQDAILTLMEELEDALYGQPMGDFGFDTYSETTGSRQFIEVEPMAGQRLFRSVLQISYLGV